MTTRPDETEEWLAHRVDAWVETYKKAMLTPMVLGVVAEHGEVEVAEVAEHLVAATGWHVTERGLYRTLQRLEAAGLLASIEVPAARTGARRKRLTVTEAGRRLLDGVRTRLVDLPGTPDRPTHDGVEDLPHVDGHSAPRTFV